MDQLRTIFEYSPAHRLGICKTHHHGVLQSQLQSHLDSKHKDLTVQTRQQMVAAARLYYNWATVEDEILQPEPGCQPIPYLPIYHHAFMCVKSMPNHQACNYIRRNIQSIQAHCCKEHGWQNTKKKGRPARGPTLEHPIMWVEKVTCQKFQPTGKLGRLFAVQQPEASHVAGTKEDVVVQEAMTYSLTQATADMESTKKKQQDSIQADQDRFQFNAWLDRAGWAKHLKGLDRSWLATTIQKPKPYETALDRVCWALQMVIWKAQQASRPSVVGMAAVNYINRREVGGLTNEKPFNARQTEKTMLKYSGWWLEIMRYIWRTHQLPPLSRKETKEGAVASKRPPYHLTARQDVQLQKIRTMVGSDKEENWFDELDSDEDELDAKQEEALEEEVLKLILQLLDHALGDHEYSSALISAMAVLGISEDSGWISPLTYTPRQAAVVNVSRMLVLYRSTQLRTSQIAKLEAEGWGRKDAEDVAPSHFHFVKEMTNKFMTLTSYNGEATPMDSIHRLKAYGMKIRYSFSAEGVVDWVDDTLLYGNIRFSMPQLRSMIHGMVASTRRQMMKELLLLQVDEEGGIVPGTTALPIIHWDRLVDNPAEQKMGWSFVDDARNQDAISVEKPKTWLERRIVQEAPLRRAFVNMLATKEARDAGGPVVWDLTRIQSYQRAMRTFREGLAALVHMTAGLPPRGSELVTIQYKNSANGESRGVFIEDGLVATVTMYHKGIGVSSKAKVIHRYLPREVGELMVYYLWLALPFAEKMERMLTKEPVESSTYIWQPEPEKEWAMPQRKRQRRQDHMESEEESDKKRPGQKELWNSNRVKAAIQKVSLEYIGVPLNIMGWRHGTKAIYRRYINSETAVQAFVQADKEESDVEDEAADLQTGHSTHIGGMIYGRPISEAMFSTESKRAAFRRVSQEWHTFLQMPSAIEGHAKKGTRAAMARQEAKEEEYRRWKMMWHVDIEEELKRLVGEQAQFRSVQKPAIKAIMRHKSPVVVVMGTGAGKSILFMMPASVSTGVTVVVVPLVSLRGDMKDRCDRLGIACVEWDSRRPHEWAQVVLVTPESAVGEAFGHFINRQRAMGRLDRIVVDECHVILDSLQGWRGRMLALRRLVMVETQMVYLTATLRPSEEAQFIQLMGLPDKAQCQWLRGATSRPNIRYQVQEYDVEEEEEAVKRVVDGIQRKYPQGQVIVYCGSVAKTVRLAEVLGCVCFHRNVGSSREKQALVEQLTSGQQQVFTATNALGLGVDAPTIRAVIHVGTIRMVRHYAQESGRAGRDGQPSEAIIMRGGRKTRQGLVPGPIPKEVEREIATLIGGKGCMREVLDRAMDGREDRKGCEEGEEKCQRCQDRWREEEPMPTSVSAEASPGRGWPPARRCSRGEEITRGEVEQEWSRRKRQAVQEAKRQAQEAMQVNKLVALMEEWKVGCQRCRAWGEKAEGHGIWLCEKEMAEETRQGIRAFEEKKRWAAYSCCFDCGLPQAVCDSFAFDITVGGYYKQQEVACPYGSVLVEMIIAMWTRHTQIIGDMIEEAMARDGWARQTIEEQRSGPGIDKMFAWFCQKKRWGGIEGNKMNWFAVQIMEQWGW